VEEWRTDLEEKKVAKEMIQILIQELDSKNEKTKEFIQYNENKRVALKRIVENFHLRNISHDSLLVLYTQSNEFEPFNSDLLAWESIVNSGKINWISPRIIRYVNSLINDYRDIEYVILMEWKVADFSYSSMLKDIPTDKYAQLMYNKHQSNDYKRIPTADLNPFLDNVLAVDYFSSRLSLSEYIFDSHNTLPLKEEALIEILEKEIE